MKPTHVCSLLLGLSTFLANAETVTVAVAANFKPPMDSIVRQFEEDSGHEVRLVYGSSEKLFAQIEHGAPFQVYFSADQIKPEILEKEGLAVSGSRFTYAVGALALWSSDRSSEEDKLTQLRQGQYNKLALANPQLAPYGAAALQVLENLHLANETRDKWVVGESIAQTYQFVATGNADLGFVALSQIMDAGYVESGSVWIVPTSLHRPILQDAVLLNKGVGNRAASELLKFVRSARARTVIKSFGYQTMPGKEP